MGFNADDAGAGLITTSSPGRAKPGSRNTAPRITTNAGSFPVSEDSEPSAIPGAARAAQQQARNAHLILFPSVVFVFLVLIFVEFVLIVVFVEVLVVIIV